MRGRGFGVGWSRERQPDYQEISSLSPEEQAKVVRFAYALDAERRLSSAELSALASRMVPTNDPAEAALLRTEITRGFYGRQAHT